jgi:hypothetical protein
MKIYIIQETDRRQSREKRLLESGVKHHKPSTINLTDPNLLISGVFFLLIVVGQFLVLYIFSCLNLVKDDLRLSCDSLIPKARRVY